MAVLHRVKRSAAKVTKAKAPDNGEYLSYRQKLERVLRTLEASSLALNQSQTMWRKMAQEEKVAAKNYATMYPDDDYVRDMALNSSKALQEVDKEFSEMQGTNSPVRQLDKEVRQYLTEIRALATDYKMVADAKIEFEIYRQKIDELEGGQKKDEGRIDRNKIKLDESRMNYESTVRATVLRQKELYPKRHTMYKASLCAYWLAQSMYVKAIERHTDEFKQYAAENMDRLLTLDVAKLERKPRPEPTDADQIVDLTSVEGSVVDSTQPAVLVPEPATAAV